MGVQVTQHKSAWHFMLELHSACSFTTRESRRTAKGIRASSSEIKRWIEQGAVLFNGERVTPTELIDFPIISIVLFPKGASRVTLW